MPAVIRGGGGGPRSGAKPKAQPVRRRRQPAAYAPAKLNGVNGVGLDRKTAVIAVSVVLAGATAILLGTGGRAQAFAGAVGHGVDGQLAALGLRVAHVELQGVSPAAAADVLARADVQVGMPIMGLDLGGVRERVEQAGWVRSARVLRFLPDTIVIAAAERSRLAVWQVGGKAYVIDAGGVAIPDADAGRFPDLPLVVGEGANEAAAAILPLLKARPRLMNTVEALVRVDARRWDLRLKDGGLIQLPASHEDAALIQLDQLDQQSRLLELGFRADRPARS